MIEAEGLTKFYGPVAAIRDVTFRWNDGEVVGFLGPNGAGKSTTMRILTCYMPPTQGQARIGGLDCFEQSLRVRQKIGYLPENVPLYADLTVTHFLRFAAGAKGVAASGAIEVQRVVGMCGLEKVANGLSATFQGLSTASRAGAGAAQ